jgi:hypothetical protein
VCFSCPQKTEQCCSELRQSAHAEEAARARVPPPLNTIGINNITKPLLSPERCAPAGIVADSTDAPVLDPACQPSNRNIGAARFAFDRIGI